MNLFPKNFAQNAFEHIQYLAGLGAREAGSGNEAKAVSYVASRFRDLGTVVEVEPFNYESFQVAAVDLHIGARPCSPTLIAFNPYEGIQEFSGRVMLVDSPLSSQDFNPGTVKDTVVVSADPGNYFHIASLGPKLILYIDPADYSEILTDSADDFTLRIKGEITTHQSANVICTSRSPVGNEAEIILCAHIDSYAGSPGANDNASGIGVLIELGRYFKGLGDQITCPIKFIAFGAEELGILGSRVYVERHAEDLKRCVLVFNLDQVGGEAGPYMEMLGGVVGMPPRKGQSQIPALYRNRALDGGVNRWRATLTPELIAASTASNHPDWLVETIQGCADELGIDFTPVGNLGSDQQSFAQAGIVSTGMGFSGTGIHTPQDTSGQIHKASLEVAGKIASAVTLKAMQNLEVKG
jgi:hypothetical protein